MFKMKLLKGETLVSLLISLGLSALLLLVAQFYAQTQQQNQRLMLQLKLQANYTHNSTHRGRSASRVGSSRKPKLIEIIWALFELMRMAQQQPLLTDNAPSNSCVLYFYDLNSNGCIGGKKYTKILA